MEIDVILRVPSHCADREGIGQELATFPVQGEERPTCFPFPTSGVLGIVGQHAYLRWKQIERINCRTMGDFQFNSSFLFKMKRALLFLIINVISACYLKSKCRKLYQKNHLEFYHPKITALKCLGLYPSFFSFHAYTHKYVLFCFVLLFWKVSSIVNSRVTTKNFVKKV